MPLVMTPSRSASPLRWHCGETIFDLSERTLIMGIVNVTPDSFSDGGQCYESHVAVNHGVRLAEEGADILDVGGESTRPGSTPVPVEVELARVMPVIEGLRRCTNVPISIDTCKAEVALKAIEAGASIINDITALRGDPAMAAVASRTERRSSSCICRVRPRPCSGRPVTPMSSLKSAPFLIIAWRRRSARASFPSASCWIRNRLRQVRRAQSGAYPPVG